MTSIRSRCPKDVLAYLALWRIVDGAVRDAFEMHPDYLAHSRRRDAQNSVTKRVVGAVLGFIDQGLAVEAAKGRCVKNAAADNASSSRKRDDASGSGTKAGGCGRDNRSPLAASARGGERFTSAGAAP